MLYCLANVGGGGGGGPGPHPPGMHIGPCRPCYNSSHAHRTRQAGSQALESRCEEGRPTQAARDTPPPPTAVPSKEGETGGEGTEDGTQQEGKAIPYYMAGAHPANALLHTSGRYESQLYPATRGQGLGNWGQSGKGYVDLCQAPNPTRSGAKGWQRLVTPPPHARWRGGVTPKYKYMCAHIFPCIVKNTRRQAWPGLLRHAFSGIDVSFQSQTCFPLQSLGSWLASRGPLRLSS